MICISSSSLIRTKYITHEYTTQSMKSVSYRQKKLLRQTPGKAQKKSPLSSWVSLSVTYPWFLWSHWYTHRTHEEATIVGAERKIFSRFMHSDTLKMHSLAVSVLRFLCKTFSRLLMLSLRKILFGG